MFQGIIVLPETALNQMLNTKRRYNKMGGRRDTILSYRLKRRQIPLIKDIAMEIIGKFVKEYLGKEFEAVMPCMMIRTISTGILCLTVFVVSSRD